MADEEKFDFGEFVASLKGTAREEQLNRVQEELGRTRQAVVREPGRKFQQDLYALRLSRLSRYLNGEDVAAELTPSEKRAYALLFGRGAPRAEASAAAAPPAPSAPASVARPAPSAPAGVALPAPSAPAGVAPPAPSAPAAEQPPESTPPAGQPQRRFRRIYLKTQARIRRDSNSEEEVLEPMTLSRGGIGFQSTKEYALQEIVWVTLHYRPEAAQLETRGMIVNVTPLPQWGAFSYGVKFLSE